MSPKIMVGVTGGASEATVGISAEAPKAVVHIHVTSDTEGLATREYVDKKIEEIEIGAVTETDPTVPEWAKQPEKPEYTADEVGARPDNWLPTADEIGAQPKGNYALKSELPSVPVQSVNGKTGAVTLNAADVEARPATWTPTASEVGADPKGTAAAEAEKALGAAKEYADQQIADIPTPDVSGQIGQHNADQSAHPYIRELVAGLVNRLNALADSDDTTLDQLSEIVAYIKSNKSLIDAITTGKVSVGDIVNNLTTNAANKPLSAAQGVVLRTMIEAITVPTALSQLTSDAAHRTVTDAEKAAWDAKSDFSGAYADLTGKPTIPTVPTKVSEFVNDAGYLTEHQDVSGKLDADKLPEAINDALEQAKASGEFDGKDGAPGQDGQPGADGTDGVSPTVSVSRSGRVTTISVTDKNGTKTATINDGADGTTPVRGADYWTDADQESIVQQVIAALGTPVFGRVDEENNIILTGTLADGTYTIKYESEDGEETLIGTLVHTSAPVPTYTNLANPSDSNWLEGKRINSSKVVVDWEGGVITNYFDVSGCKEYIAVRGINLLNGNSRYYKYHEVGGTLQEGTNISTSGHVAQSDYDPSVYHIPASDIQSAKIWRLGGLLTGTSADVIITIDEEIK